MKCQTVRYEVLQNAFISAGGSLSTAGAQPGRVMMSNGFKTQCCKIERREEERIWKHPWPLKAF